MLSALIPGANLTVQTQRAGDDRAQTRFSVHGAPEAQPIVDGVNQQIVGCTIGCFVFSQLNIQEVVVESAGGGADRDFGGLQLTMVPRDGGNTFSGQAMFSYTAPGFVSSNINDELLARNLNPDRLGTLKKSPGERCRSRRSDQARPALVLCGCPRRRDADVCGRRLLEQADAAAIAALRAGRGPRRGERRLVHQGLHRPLHVAGGARAQVRVCALVAAELQLPVQPDWRLAAHTRSLGPAPVRPELRRQHHLDASRHQPDPARGRRIGADPEPERHPRARVGRTRRTGSPTRAST